MEDITFKWIANISCVEVNELTDVAIMADWQCIASLGEASVWAGGITQLGPVDPKAFVPLKEITSDVIRSWVSEADEVESGLADRVTILSYLPEPTILKVPLED